MPTTSRPGMGASMRIERAASAMARSSARPSMRDSLTRASGLTSYWVTTGPRVRGHDRGRDLEAAQLLLDDADVADVVEAAPRRRRLGGRVEQLDRAAAPTAQAAGSGSTSGRSRPQLAGRSSCDRAAACRTPWPWAAAARRRWRRSRHRPAESPARCCRTTRSGSSAPGWAAARAARARFIGATGRGRWSRLARRRSPPAGARLRLSPRRARGRRLAAPAPASAGDGAGRRRVTG